MTLDDVRLEHVPDSVLPVLAGVGGPSAGPGRRVADGVVLGGPSTVPHCRAAREAGHERAGWQVEAFVTLAVAGDARDACRQMAPFVAEALSSVGFRRLPFLDELRTCHETDGVDGIVAMPRDWWLQIGAIGTRDDAVEHLALLEAGGLSPEPPPSRHRTSTPRGRRSST